ncbi:hypothetical protein [Streptomyces sp. NPDC051000]|uniref:hypothetical protein n=1 Tax=Streptomyces sp. NPDC051000 TaxID=3155520 RepID=UPI0033F36F78
MLSAYANPLDLYLRSMAGGCHLYFDLTRRYARGSVDAADGARGAALPQPLDSAYLFATLCGSLAPGTEFGSAAAMPGRCDKTLDLATTADE